jgi:hypothetical protein
VKAVDDEAVAFGIEQRQGKALIAASLLERIEADQAGSLEGSTAGRLEHRGADGQLVDLPIDGQDPIQVRFEDALEAPAIRVACQAGQATLEPPHPASQDRDEHEYRGEQDREGRRDDPDSGLDERVEVDERALPGGRSSLAGGPARTNALRADTGPPEMGCVWRTNCR